MLHLSGNQVAHLLVKGPHILEGSRSVGPVYLGLHVHTCAKLSGEGRSVMILTSLSERALPIWSIWSRRVDKSGLSLPPRYMRAVSRPPAMYVHLGSVGIIKGPAPCTHLRWPCQVSACHLLCCVCARAHAHGSPARPENGKHVQANNSCSICQTRCRWPSFPVMMSCCTFHSMHVARFSSVCRGLSRLITPPSVFGESLSSCV